MTYKYLTTRELTLIANFWHQGTKAYQAAKLLKRSQETIYRVYRFLDSGKTIAQYLKAYQRNKQRCGRKQAQLAKDEISYINEQVKAGWTPDTIIGRAERTISCSMRTLYRMFARGQYNFAVQQLPMKGKRHPNGYVERRGKAGLILVDDDAQGAQLKALTANGKFGQAIDFSQKGQSLADLIAALARQHYLVNSTATDNFDYQTGANHQADDAKNQFVIHFVHEKIPTQRTATITRTVHYQYENGQLADDDQVAQQVVTQTGEKDLVTNQEHYDQQWSANVAFEAGRLPSHVGYTAKIDDQVVTEVPADQVTITGADFKDQAVETTVVYHANEQHAQLVIIDDDASEAIQRTLQTLTATGKYATAIDFTADGQSLAAILTSWQQRGYTVKSNSFTAGTTYQVDDKQNQFVVHLKHKTQATSRTKTVTQKITYHLPDGTTKVVPRTLTFTQGGTTDLVTGATTWDANWTQTDHFTGLTSPNYPGYTPSQAEAGASTVTVNDANWATDLDQTLDITYTANSHTTPIEYVDDDANGHVVKTGELTGRTGETVATNVTNPDPNKYEVVPGAPMEITFGPDGHAKVTVHLKHKTQATSRTKTVTQKITYHLPDGTTKVVPRTLTFTQGGTTDLATGETTWDANWTQTQILAAVASPIYNGYTASAAMAGATQITVTTPTWTTNLDQQIDVYYTPTTTQIPIYYYDENGHPIADPIIVDGNGATNFDEYHKVITGYQFERREIKGADGRLTEVIFYYLKTTNGGEITPPVQPVQPVGPSQPAQPTAPSQPTPTSSGQGTPTAEQELPQTGNQTSETSVLGLTLLGVLGLLGLSKRKRKE